MSGHLESTVQTASNMAERWRWAGTTTVLDFGGGVSANLLNASAGEIFSVPSEAHILCLTIDGDQHHHQWRDDRLIHQGPLPARASNIVRSGEAPRAVLGEPIRVLHMYIPAAPLKKIAAERGLPQSPHGLEIIDPGFSPDPALTALLEVAATAMIDDSPQDRLWRESLALAIQARIIQRWSNLSVCEETRPLTAARSCDRRLQRAIDFMESRLFEDFGVSEVAAVVGLSTTYLRTLFTTALGVTPHRWLMTRRIERACEMLVASGVNVTEVAHACGFASSQHMATVFKKRLGTTPRQYRQERLA